MVSPGWLLQILQLLLLLLPDALNPHARVHLARQSSPKMVRVSSTTRDEELKRQASILSVVSLTLLLLVWALLVARKACLSVSFELCTRLVGDASVTQQPFPLAFASLLRLLNLGLLVMKCFWILTWTLILQQAGSCRLTGWKAALQSSQSLIAQHSQQTCLERR